MMAQTALGLVWTVTLAVPPGRAPTAETNWTGVPPGGGRLTSGVAVAGIGVVETGVVGPGGTPPTAESSTLAGAAGVMAACGYSPASLPTSPPLATRT